MELCCTTTRTISNLPHHTLFSAATHTHLRPKTSLPLKPNSISPTNPGCLYYAKSSLRSTSEETSTTTNQYVEEESNSAIATEDRQIIEKNSYGETIPNETIPNEVPNGVSPVDEPTQPFEFLDKLDIKVDSEDSLSILLIGGGALVALWLSAAIVGSIDSIPVFPKLMEVVGLGYTLWFSTRYLIFKNNREELIAKIEEIKQQVLGSDDD